MMSGSDPEDALGRIAYDTLFQGAHVAPWDTLPDWKRWRYVQAALAVTRHHDAQQTDGRLRPTRVIALRHERKAS